MHGGGGGGSVGGLNAVLGGAGVGEELSLDAMAASSVANDQLRAEALRLLQYDSIEPASERSVDRLVTACAIEALAVIDSRRLSAAATTAAASSSSGGAGGGSTGGGSKTSRNDPSSSSTSSSTTSSILSAVGSATSGVSGGGSNGSIDYHSYSSAAYPLMVRLSSAQAVLLLRMAEEPLALAAMVAVAAVSSTAACAAVGAAGSAAGLVRDMKAALAELGAQFAVGGADTAGAGAGAGDGSTAAGAKAEPAFVTPTVGILGGYSYVLDLALRATSSSTTSTSSTSSSSSAQHESRFVHELIDLLWHSYRQALPLISAKVLVTCHPEPTQALLLREHMVSATQRARAIRDELIENKRNRKNGGGGGGGTAGSNAVMNAVAGMMGGTVGGALSAQAGSSAYGGASRNGGGGGGAGAAGGGGDGGGEKIGAGGPRMGGPLQLLGPNGKPREAFEPLHVPSNAASSNRSAGVEAALAAGVAERVWEMLNRRACYDQRLRARLMQLWTLLWGHCTTGRSNGSASTTHAGMATVGGSGGASGADDNALAPPPCLRFHPTRPAPTKSAGWEGELKPLADFLRKANGSSSGRGGWLGSGRRRASLSMGGGGGGGGYDEGYESASSTSSRYSNISAGIMGMGGSAQKRAGSPFLEHGSAQKRFRKQATLKEGTKFKLKLGSMSLAKGQI
jgi:hypothetical protein